MSTPNEHGVYVDDLEELELKGRGIRASISIAECDDGLWRWGYDLFLRGSPDRKSVV